MMLSPERAKEKISWPRKMDAEIARAYQVHPITLSKWKKEFWEKGAEVFGGRDEVRSSEQKISKLERMLGQKEVELALSAQRLRSASYHGGTAGTTGLSDQQ